MDYSIDLKAFCVHPWGLTLHSRHFDRFERVSCADVTCGLGPWLARLRGGGSVCLPGSFSPWPDPGIIRARLQKRIPFAKLAANKLKSSKYTNVYGDIFVEIALEPQLVSLGTFSVLRDAGSFCPPGFTRFS